MAVPYAAASRNREAVIRIQQLMRPPNEKHDRQKPEDGEPDGEPEPEVEAEKSASATPVPASDWEDVLTRETTVEGQVGDVLRILLLVTLLYYCTVIHAVFGRRQGIQPGNSSNSKSLLLGDPA